MNLKLGAVLNGASCPLQTLCEASLTCQVSLPTAVMNKNTSTSHDED